MANLNVDCKCDKEKTIQLESGKQVCSYCPQWKDECLKREQLARKLLSMTDNEGRREYVKLRDSGMNMDKLDSVIKRIKNAN